jgi:hypothetical protein
MRLEMGDIWNGRFFHGFVPTEPNSTHVLAGWPEDRKWGGLELCRIVNVHNAKGKGALEGSFSLIQRLSAHTSLSIGRTRGEFEEATRALTKAHRALEIDERFWTLDTSVDAMRLLAQSFNQRAKVRRAFGRTPVTPEDLLRNARGPALVESEHWRFCPVKKTAVVRGGHVEIDVAHYPRSFKFRVNGIDDRIHLDHGYTVLVAFDPGKPHEGCWIFNGEFGVKNRDRFGLAEKLMRAPQAEDVPQINFHTAGAFAARKKSNAALQSRFRGIARAGKHDYAQDSNGKELSVRVDETGRTVESHSPQSGSAAAPAPQPSKPVELPWSLRRLLD